MNTICNTKYKIYNKKNNNEFRICMINDIHFTSNTSMDKLVMILYKLERLLPDYIMIPGDIIDSTNELENLETRKKILLWFKEVRKLCPTLLSFGSHDYAYKCNNKWLYQFDQEFFDELSSYYNIHLLNNSSFSDNKISVFGYTQSSDYYNSFNKEEIIYRDCELMSVMIEELKQLKSQIEKISDNTNNFLMVHSPTYLNNKEVDSLLTKFDYYLSGHMHNGLVPPILNEIWNSSLGIISANRTLFADNCRNTLKNKDDKLIVNGPITTFHENHGLLSKLNFLYPSNITTIDFTNNKEFDTKKIYVKRYYGN